MKGKLLLITLLFSLNFSLRAQKAYDEYKKTMTAYANAKQFSFDVDVYAYENKTDKKAQLIGSGKARKKEQFFYSRFLEKEMLVGPEITISVNHDNKTIDCFEYDFA